MEMYRSGECAAGVAVFVFDVMAACDVNHDGSTREVRDSW